MLAVPQLPDHAARAPQSLKYARVASVVRAAAFHITPAVRPGDLPFCGPVLASQIADIAASGTTRQLEEHECAARASWAASFSWAGVLLWRTPRSAGGDHGRRRAAGMTFQWEVHGCGTGLSVRVLRAPVTAQRRRFCRMGCCRACRPLPRP